MPMHAERREVHDDLTLKSGKNEKHHFTCFALEIPIPYGVSWINKFEYYC